MNFFGPSLSHKQACASAQTTQRQAVAPGGCRARPTQRTCRRWLHSRRAAVGRLCLRTAVACSDQFAAIAKRRATACRTGSASSARPGIPWIRYGTLAIVMPWTSWSRNISRQAPQGGTTASSRSASSGLGWPDGVRWCRYAAPLEQGLDQGCPSPAHTARHPTDGLAEIRRRGPNFVRYRSMRMMQHATVPPERSVMLRQHVVCRADQRMIRLR